jgi:outer membrane PBP1 activator LpoA protein
MRPAARLVITTLLGLALAWVAAFSAAQTPPASDVPAREPAAPDRGAVTIALVLPLDAPTYARAADAVRAGFLAAADAAGARGQVKVFAHDDDGVLSAFEAAREAGATVVVGPLVRDDLRTVTQLALALPNTVALNQLDDGVEVPDNLYTFALAIEGDARVIARRLRNEAIQNVAVVNADTPLMRRFAGAFASEWLAAGGSVPPVFRFEATPNALTSMRRELNRKPPEAALLALDSASATLAKPYLGTVPVYASGLVFERETQAVARDLDGIYLMEIPWIITPNAPQFAHQPKQEFASAALTRLYALGLDAFRVAQAFHDGAPARFSLEGATGQVSLGEGRQFVREGRLGVFRAGQLAPLDGAR